MCKIKDYPGLYAKAMEKVRLTGIKSTMPGYEMLIKAIVIYKVDGKKDLYQHVAEESSVVPSNHTPAGMHPVEQILMEAMRSIGINYDKVMTFVEELAEEI